MLDKGVTTTSGNAKKPEPANTASVPCATTLEPKKMLWAAALWLIGLTACFAEPLFQLVTHALHSADASHVLLVPFVCIYLVRIRRATATSGFKPSPVLGVVALLAGGGILAARFAAARSGWQPALNDHLAVMTFAYLMFIYAGWLLFLGATRFRAHLFPAAFLLFMIPLPEFAKAAFERILQQCSAVAATAMITLSGMPVLSDGTTLQMPGFTFEVAPECSGIRSTLVLLLTSLLAGYILLRRPWSRAVLVLFVIPLGILRNGFRILVLAQLCMRVSPDMIHSSIHKKGGPIFFTLSLVPLFLLFWLLRKMELRRSKQAL